MPFLIRLLPTCLRTAIFGLLTIAGCAPPPSNPIIGIWQGTMPMGSIAAPVQWEIHTEGTQSETLTLPQGLIVSLGTFTAASGQLNLRTTIRASVIGGEQKIMPLANPMETTFGYQISGDTLTLTEADTHQKIILTRTHETLP